MHRHHLSNSGFPEFLPLRDITLEILLPINRRPLGIELNIPQVALSFCPDKIMKCTVISILLTWVTLSSSRKFVPQIEGTHFSISKWSREPLFLKLGGKEENNNMQKLLLKKLIDKTFIPQSLNNCISYK